MHVVHFGQLLIDKRQIRHVCADVDVFRVDELGNPIVRLLQQCSPCAKEVEELLGLHRTADRPETSPVATSQDETILVVSHVMC